MRPALLVLVAALAACATGPRHEIADPPERVAYQVPLEVPQMAAGAFYTAHTLVDAQKAQTAPIGPDDTTYTNTQNVGTTALPLFDSPANDLAVGLRTSIVNQSLRISNRSSANTLCVWFKQFTTDCSTTCTAAPKTCDGSATDGEPIQPGAVFTVPITGAFACVCGRASAATTLTTATRLVREKER